MFLELPAELEARIQLSCENHCWDLQSRYFQGSSLEPYIMPNDIRYSNALLPYMASSSSIEVSSVQHGNADSFVSTYWVWPFSGADL